MDLFFKLKKNNKNQKKINMETIDKYGREITFEKELNLFERPLYSDDGASLDYCKETYSFYYKKAFYMQFSREYRRSEYDKENSYWELDIAILGSNLDFDNQIHQEKLEYYIENSDKQFILIDDDFIKIDDDFIKIDEKENFEIELEVQEYMKNFIKELN